MEKLKCSYIAGRNVKYALENNWQFLKRLNIKLHIWPSNSSPQSLPNRMENICSYKKLYMNAQSNGIHNIQKVKTTRMSSQWWTDKQNVV